MSQQTAQSDKRKFSRFAFDSSIILEKNGQKWQSLLHDISLRGVLVSKPENWDDDNEGDFKVFIQLDNSEIEINMDVKLAHAENHHLGFSCERIDLDSITNLRRLVELNLADEKLLEREISNMIIT